MRRTRVLNRVSLWQHELPYITPMYAIKSNDNPHLASWLHGAGVGFDCASAPEIKRALATGSTNIIYANPCKAESHIMSAMADGCNLTTVDDVAEIHKLVDIGYRGDILIRLKVDDAASKMPFSKKFGCPMTYLESVLAAAASALVLVRGFSFHVGSEAAAGTQFTNALHDAAAGFELAKKYGFTPDHIDIGGGFPGGTDVAALAKFREHATAIRDAAPLFPKGVRWLAEPGRFFSASSTILFVRVTSERPSYNYPGSQVITVNESTYGMFSNIMYDMQRPKFEKVEFNFEDTFDCSAHTVSESLVPTVIFGQSCDSMDLIAEGVMLPRIKRGDYLKIDNMGAYSAVSCSTGFNGGFNGFERTEHVLA